MFGLYSRIAAAIVLAMFLAGVYWKGHTSGAKSVQVLWDADVAQRTAQALEASEKARKVEQELSAKVGRIDRAYQDQKRATAHVAAAVAVGMRELETALAAAPSGSASAPDTSGVAGADPRPTIAGECVRQLVALEEAYGKLVDKARAMQALSGIVRVKP